VAKVSNDRAFQQDIRHLEKIFELMDKHQIAELEWEKAGEKLKLKARQSVLPVETVGILHSNGGLGLGSPQRSVDSLTGNRVERPTLTTAPPLPHPPSNTTGSALPTPQSGAKQALSPFVGTFYRAAAPSAAPYVKEGQSVKRGDVLCIIEAMKLMNEIEAEFPGKIISVLVENGQPVEFGEPLFLIEPH